VTISPHELQSRKSELKTPKEQNFFYVIERSVSFPTTNKTPTAKGYNTIQSVSDMGQENQRMKKKNKNKNKAKEKKTTNLPTRFSLSAMET